MTPHEIWPPGRRAAQARTRRAEQHRVAECTPPSEVAKKMLNAADSISAMAARIAIYVAELESYHGPLQRWATMRHGIDTLHAAAAVLREIANETGANHANR